MVPRGTASLWVRNLGTAARISLTRSRPDDEDRGYHTFTDFGNRPANAVCEALAARAPMRRQGLPDSGAVTRSTSRPSRPPHFVNLGSPSACHLISRTQGYHGTTATGTALGASRPNVVNWGPLVPQTSSVPMTRSPLWRRRSPRRPGQGRGVLLRAGDRAGGVFPPHDGYIQGVADLCAEHGILLVIDAVICGFGRLGTWFGIERWPDVKPSMIAFAKGVTSGYLPLGGVVVDETVSAPYFEAPGGPMFRHAPRTPASVGLRGRARDDRESTSPRTSSRAGPRVSRLDGWPRSRTIRGERGRGGTGFSRGRRQRAGGRRHPDRGGAQGRRARPPVAGRRRVSPPLICEQEHIDLIAQAIKAGLDECSGWVIPTATVVIS